MSVNKTCPSCGGYVGSVVIRQLPACDANGAAYPEGNIPPIHVCTCDIAVANAAFAALWPSILEPTPEEIERRRIENAVQIKRAEARQARIENILARLGGRKTQELSDEHYQVAYDVDDEVTVCIAGDNNSFDMEDQVNLSPQAALSLLVWLERERPTLEQLTKGE